MNLKSSKHNFVYMLTILHLPFLWEAFWYDESALIENVNHVGLTDFSSGLNWLQTIPAGYFLISRVILEAPGGFIVLRLLSLFFLIWGIRIIDQNFLSLLKNEKLRILILALMILNSFSLKYGTDSKPYTLEFLLSAAFIVCSTKKQFFKLFLLAIFAPFLAASSFIAGFGCIFATAIRTRMARYAIPIVVLIGSTFANSLLVPESTKKAMQIAWFGNLAGFGFQSIKSAIGGIFWIPISGMGLIPDDFRLTGSYALSSITYCSITFFVLVKSWKTEVTQKLIFSSLLALFLHSLLLVPVAGRLMQGLSLMLLLSLTLNLDEIYRKKLVERSLNLLVAVLLILSVSQKYEGFEIHRPVISYLGSGQTYANIWAGPEVQNELRYKGKELSPNLIIEVSTGTITSCKSIQFFPGDNLVLKNINPSLRQDFVKIKNLKVTHSTSSTVVFGVLIPFKSISVKSQKDYFECAFRYRNSELRSSL